MLSISPGQVLGSQSRNLERRELATSDDFAFGQGKEKKQPKPWKDAIDSHGILSSTLSPQTMDLCCGLIETRVLEKQRVIL